MITTPATAPVRKSLMKKQIPTLLGLVVLIAGLAIGAFLFTKGTGIFLPRATPETTPKEIRISNLNDQGFSISFMTDSATSGFIRYGTDPQKLTQVGDQRDQLTGSVGEYTLHHISILRGLEPNTTYYYVLGTGKGALFDDNGEPFTIKTAQQAGTQPKALTVFGSAVTATGSPAAGAVVFVTPPNAGTLSSLVTNTGSWAVSLSTARTKDGSDYAAVEIGDELAIKVMAINPKDNTDIAATVEAETAIAIKLGSGQVVAATPTPEPEPTPDTETAITPDASDSGALNELTDGQAGTASDSSALAMADTTTPTASPAAQPTQTESLATLAALETTASESDAVTVLALTAADPPSTQTPPVVETTTPKITGVAAPNVTVTIQVHSDTEISTQVVADASGNFELDIAQLSQQLEPGEHTINYSYTDPTTGEVVNKTRTFTVAPRVMLAATNTSPTPYSSGNPYAPGGTTTPTPTPTPTPSPLITPVLTPTATPLWNASDSANLSTHSANIGTGSGLPTSGSVGTTMLLLGSGLFFLISGVWSWWVSKEWRAVEY